MGFDPIYMAITAFAMLASQFVGSMLKKRFQEYSQIPLQSGLSGKEVAEQMLRENGLTDVKVISVEGQLTDHYNPRDRTVNLSSVVYNERHVGAAAVAAHECGHAIQHATSYPMLGFRSFLVPYVQMSSRMVQFVLGAGIAIYMASQNYWVLLAGIILFGVSTAFSLVTLPVEFNATSRALTWLKTANITNGPEYEKAQTALKWAAMTYVVAALASLGQLLYYLMIFMRARNRRR